MKKLSKIIDILKSKWLRDTGMTAILIAAIVVMFLGINALMKYLDIKDIDLTKEKLYSLTEETKERIAALPETDKINIYMIDFKEQDAAYELAKLYTKINKNISLEIVDLEERPDFKTKYHVDTGFYTVIIDAGEKNKILTSADFYNVDYSTGETTDITEQRLTNSILALSSVGKTVPIYTLSGHNEKIGNMTVLKTYLELENFELKDLDLLTAQKVPDDCENLIIASPTKDFTDLEANALKEYIQRGGNIVWLNDPYAAEGETPYMKSVLDMYGVTIRQDGVVFEQDTSRMVMGNPDFILPSIEQSDITAGIGTVLLMDSGKLDFASDEELENLKVRRTELLRTTSNSFFRTDLKQTSFTPVEGEAIGTSVVAALLEKQLEEEKTSKLIVFANNLFATDRSIYVGQSAVPAIGFYANKDLIINSIQYMSNVDDTITIRKTITNTRYTATETQDRIIKAIIFTLPVVIVIFGIVIWQLRRRKK